LRLYPTPGMPGSLREILRGSKVSWEPRSAQCLLVKEAIVIKNSSFRILLSVALLLLFGAVQAQSDKELRDQRSAAHKERQAETKALSQEITDATRVFKEYARNLEQEYREQLRELDVEFELRQVQLQGDQDRQVAAAEAELQKQWTAIFMPTGAEDVSERLETLQDQVRAHSDALFQIRKEAAERLHREKMTLIERQHALLGEMDERLLAEAESLGLMAEYFPVLATPIGGELTRQEEQWNQRAEKEAEKMRDRNAGTLSKYANGERLRAWERANLEEDFELQWAERDELRELDSQHAFVNTMMLQAGQAEEASPQLLMDQLAELNQQQQLIKIKYEQIRKENTIKRREERKRMTAG